MQPLRVKFGDSVRLKFDLLTANDDPAPFAVSATKLQSAISHR
jgi:hypothetical protein